MTFWRSIVKVATAADAQCPYIITQRNNTWHHACILTHQIITIIIIILLKLRQRWMFISLRSCILNTHTHTHTNRSPSNLLNDLSTPHCAQTVVTCISWRQNKYGPAQRSRYGLCRSEFEPLCRQKIFLYSTPVPTDAGASCTMGNGDLSRAYSDRGGGFDPPPPSSAVVRNGYSHTSTPLLSIMECYADTFHSITRLILADKRFPWHFNRIPASFRRISELKITPYEH